jgi:RNA polymerase sigma-70 factor (ECF subfamily)
MPRFSRLSTSSSAAAAVPSELSDAELFAACQAGDERAFRALVDRHDALVRRLAMNILRDEQEAEDVAQEAFVAVWRNRHGWKPEARFTTWLYRIAVNKAIDRYRARRICAQPDEMIARLADAAVEPTAQPEQEQALERRQMSDAMREAMKTLPANQRTALTLFYFEDFDVMRIAQEMATSEQSVRSLLKRGRQALRAQLQRREVRAGHGSRSVQGPARDAGR